MGPSAGSSDRPLGSCRLVLSGEGNGSHAAHGSQLTGSRLTALCQNVINTGLPHKVYAIMSSPLLPASAQQ